MAFFFLFIMHIVVMVKECACSVMVKSTHTLTNVYDVMCNDRFVSILYHIGKFVNMKSAFG